MSAETPDTIHGRLMEGVHIVGYTFERACTALKWLLTDNRWQEVGDGFDDINTFLDTIKLTGLKDAVTERKEIARLLAGIGASQRATARALGVGLGTVQRDLDPNGSNAKLLPIQEELVTPSDPSGSPDRLDAPAFLGDEAEVMKEGSDARAHVVNNSGEIEWYTPSEYIEAARRVLGAIDLDPASCEAANAVVRAASFYTKDDNALVKEWAGRVWMNPPYSAGLMTPFCAKFLQELDGGRVVAAIVLTNNATETSWFQGYSRNAMAMCIPQSRIRFWRVGAEAFTPLQGQALFYFGDDRKRFREEFAGFGDVWERRDAD